MKHHNRTDPSQMIGRKITALRCDGRAHGTRSITQDWYIVGRRGVREILEHHCGEGDCWYYDVHFDDGSADRRFDPVEVQFAPEDDA